MQNILRKNIMSFIEVGSIYSNNELILCKNIKDILKRQLLLKICSPVITYMNF